LVNRPVPSFPQGLDLQRPSVLVVCSLLALLTVVLFSLLFVLLAVRDVFTRPPRFVFYPCQKIRPALKLSFPRVQPSLFPLSIVFAYGFFLSEGLCFFSTPVANIPSSSFPPHFLLLGVCFSQLLFLPLGGHHTIPY